MTTEMVMKTETEGETTPSDSPRYFNHSGGAEGADMAWDLVGQQFGVESIHYSFYGHSSKAKTKRVLTYEELEEGFLHIIEASKKLKRNVFHLQPYVQNLLARNWYQVLNSEAIFPVGVFGDKKGTEVSGGTGWAVQMAIDTNKPVFFFEQNICEWFTYDYESSRFILTSLPKLTRNFAGIGTREINDEGLQAIGAVYENTFSRRV